MNRAVGCGRRLPVPSRDEVPAKDSEPTGRPWASILQSPDSPPHRQPAGGNPLLTTSTTPRRSLPEGSEVRPKHRTAREPAAGRHHKIDGHRRDFHQETPRTFVKDYDLLCTRSARSAPWFSRGSPCPTPDNPAASSRTGRRPGPGSTESPTRRARPSSPRSSGAKRKRPPGT